MDKLDINSDQVIFITFQNLLELASFEENPTFIPIEVKYKRFKKPKLTKSFYSFIDEYKPSIGIVATKGFFGFEVFKNTRVLVVPVYVL